MFEELEKQFGEHVVYNGKSYWLTQEVYLDGEIDKTPYYQAAGIDEHGRECTIIWAIDQEYFGNGDQGDDCDWENPVEVIEL
ncbi:hypothetical protein [Limosilactobacillus ingluviei]|uniref:Uncharacterized protein n=1 Tax=Limosilactobacillus ingluviei DSM 15946 TaxID=1423760 RepID=A0A0R1ULL0_9LACO|nr:hypothetical protein [Limosilactobacillus ingluviei]KRL91666.1 hypothetical protein FC43_GL001086 [Limosilactobacillus ingluviei DSM 15946]